MSSVAARTPRVATEDSDVMFNDGAEQEEEEEDARDEDDRQPTFLLQLLLCAVSALEGADTALLPAAMFALQQDLGLHLKDLAWLGVAQAVATNLAGPFWGVLADRGALSRRTILVIGALGQGFVTVLLAFVTAMQPMLVLRACNGAMLAALRPLSNGIIADTTAEAYRGKIFGRVQSSLLLGMFVSSMVTGSISRAQVWDLDGWRVAFIIVGAISVCVSAAVFFFLGDPLRQDYEKSGRGCFGVVGAEIASLCKFFSIPTFCIMIMQGIFGTIPWSVMGNMMLFFQLTGLSDAEAATLSGSLTVSGVFGNLLGGAVADAFAERFGYHGRPLSAQITVLLGVPLIWLLFWGVEPGEGTFWGYLCITVCFGLFGTWAQSGTNFPILSEIVPAAARSRVMAWECALENSVAFVLGPPAVAFLATDCFGYTFGDEDTKEAEADMDSVSTLGGPTYALFGATSGEDDAAKSLESAAALGKAMVAVTCLPWVICFVAYSLLHWSYHRDVENAMDEEHVRYKVGEDSDPEVAEE